MQRTRFFAIGLCCLLGLVTGLSGCSLDGLWLQPRDNPQDLYYPPEVARIYAGDLNTPLSSGGELASDTTPLFVRFTQVMDQPVTGTAIRILDRDDNDNQVARTITWIDSHTARVNPDSTWDDGLNATLLVLDDATNINEITMIAPYTTYFTVPE
ncbi:hypothetical protein [Spirochaeta africana]|uniref:SbsA Ig-like domain-containing protein n=1 Tax=Spirochaeta africana (strain ATCC 700263 / DSM 8902 / Z-7692) TaxID=889378 RepID=H9ULU4_SPIAZ|nr:hypothetical protein [Spirochaeta africana]AFG38487.1 hypothetical protein Spiaf_2456 [Spirochaeta africana DSM 8902]